MREIAGPRTGILVLAYSTDSGVDAVCARLAEAGVETFRLSTADKASRILSFDPRDGALSTGSGRIPSADLVWNRRTYFAADRSIEPCYRDFALDEYRQGILGSLHALGARWFPDPGRLATAARKALQLAYAARDERLRIPDTLITSDPEAARTFIERQKPGCIVKSLGRPVIERDDRTSVMYTTLVDDRVRDAIDSVRTAPVIFQQYIERAFDVRVTVIGDEVFATRVDNDADDEASRADCRIGGLKDSLRFSETSIESEVAQACRDMLAHFGLRFGCFDFAVDRDGVWYFLEVNPNGQWYWIEQATQVPIAKAMADELLRQLHGQF